MIDMRHTITIPTLTNKADQQRRNSDLETEIQLLREDIRNLNNELIDKTVEKNTERK